MVGRQDKANHPYDLAPFWAAAKSGNMPAVTFLKAPRFEDGHAGHSDPWVYVAGPLIGATAGTFTYELMRGL